MGCNALVLSVVLLVGPGVAAFFSTYALVGLGIAVLFALVGIGLMVVSRSKGREVAAREAVMMPPGDRHRYRASSRTPNSGPSDASGPARWRPTHPSSGDVLDLTWGMAPSRDLSDHSCEVHIPLIP